MVFEAGRAEEALAKGLCFSVRNWAVRILKRFKTLLWHIAWEALPVRSQSHAVYATAA